MPVYWEVRDENDRRKSAWDKIMNEWIETAAFFEGSLSEFVRLNFGLVAHTNGPIVETLEFTNEEELTWFLLKNS